MAIKKIKIAMRAEYLSDVKSIATYAPTFFGYIISVLANVTFHQLYTVDVVLCNYIFVSTVTTEYRSVITKNLI